MKILFYVVLSILVFLAISSGISKILLMQQDVEFFSKYGFSNSILFIYGVAQLLGGILLVLPKFRFIGAALVALTFLISAVVLVLDDNIPVTIITLICVLLLGGIMKISLNKTTQQFTET